MIILIVDDLDEKLKKIENVILETYDNSICKIIKAKNSSDAIQILLKVNKIDLMILDLNLPVRDGEWPKQNSGLNLLKELVRRNELTRPESIIGLTAHETIKNSNQLLFHKEGWIIAHYNPKLSDWEEVIKNKLIYLYSKSDLHQDGKPNSTTMNNVNEIPTVVILTAIKEEYIAVRKHLSSIEDADIEGTSYESGVFIFNEKNVAKIIIRECGAKNSNASQETERAIIHFKPKCILFVGIAGSRKQGDFEVGDVIFPEKIYSYEGGKADKGAFMARPDLGPLTYTLIEKAKKERLKDDWKILIKGKYDSVPKADLGIIASGDLLIEHYDSSIGQILTDHYNDTSAVEMEGFGFAKAASRQGGENAGIFYGVIRGISDIIKKEGVTVSQGNISNENRPIKNKEYASDTASAFAFWLIIKTFTKM